VIYNVYTKIKFQRFINICMKNQMQGTKNAKSNL